MKSHVRHAILVGALCAGGGPSNVAAQRWYAGTWDSTVYNRIEHPKTVGIRIEVRDADTGEPLEGITLALKGAYREERVGTSGDEYGLPYEPQDREYDVRTKTGPDGVAVFALGWKKQYPWDLGRANKTNSNGTVVYYDVHRSWTRPVDDIEKINRIETQDSTYRRRVIPFDFRHITEVGQDEGTESQSPAVFRAFEDAWHGEMRQPGVKPCILDLGTSFPDFQNVSCSRPEFFGMIRDKNYGQVFTAPQNFFSFGEHPQSECGPYFVYEVEIELERAVPQVEIKHSTSQRSEPPAGNDTEEPAPVVHARNVPTLARSTAVVVEPQRQEVDQEAQGPRPEMTQAAERLQQEVEVPAPKPDSIGLVVVTLSTDQQRRAGLYPGVQGAWVNYVAPGSPADRAGLQAGMVIESIDQQFVGNAEDYSSRVRGKQPGAQFDVGVWEKGAKWARSSRRVSL